jgi:hypothetical protein
LGVSSLFAAQSRDEEKRDRCPPPSPHLLEKKTEKLRLGPVKSAKVEWIATGAMLPHLEVAGTAHRFLTGFGIVFTIQL